MEEVLMKALRLVLLIAAAFLVSPLTIAADQTPDAPKLEVQQQDTIESILRRHVGKRVTVRLEGGEELTGIVRTVGAKVVHLSDLANRDFYDAVIELEDLSAVVIRVRGA
jgi:small nuclear ribonucleoprotein (snRNP)-like protein